MKRIHYAWVVCAAATLATISNLGLCGTLMSAYMPYIAATGVSGSVISTMVSIRSLFSLVGLFFVSVYYRMFSLRKGIALASVFGAAAMLIFSVGGNAYIYYAGSALAGLVIGIGSSFPTSLLLTRWFRRRIGLALGICASGSGISLVCFPALIDKIVNMFGLQVAFWCLSGFSLVSALVVGLLIRNAPQEMGLSAFDRGPEPKTAANATEGFHVSAGIMILLLIQVILVSGISSTGSSHLTILMTSSGYDSDVAALFLSMFGLCLTAGKFIYGAAADRMGTKTASVVVGVILVVGLMLPCFMDGEAMWPCATTMLLLGLGYPPSTLGIALWATDFSSIKTYEKTLKRMQILGSVGGVVIGAMPGRIYDAFGHYQGAYVVLAIGSALCIPMLLIAYRARKPVCSPVE